MSFPAYPGYKDSGVQWIGSVPEHWDVVRLRNIFLIQKRIAGKLGFDVLSITNKGVKVKDIESGDGQLSSDYSKYQLVMKGEFAMNHMDLVTGYVDISAFDGVTSPDYRVFSAAHPELDNPRYMLRLLQNAYHQKLFFPFGQGSAHLGRWRLPAEEFKDFFFPRPSRLEQTQIARFLDHEAARIDALIAEQQHLIELLKEKRQAVISHAVTKGLDPTVPMKDSGVEWLGEVPAHWEVTPLKHVVATPITDGPHETPDFIDEGVLFVSAEAVSSGRINFSKARYISRDDHLRYSRKYRPQKFDIYMVKSGATTGVTAIVETDDEFNVWSPLAVVRCKPQYSPYFVLFSMRSRNFQESVVVNWSFGTQQNIGMNVIENLPIACPPADEQKKIAAFITQESEKWDSLISEGVSAVHLLQERRSALISAAVTGKIDVRGWQPPASTQAPEPAVAEAV
jgi:type I restriction enzyme S subunit